MKKAIKAVTMQKSLRQAAREYGVPATTLKRINTSLPAEAKPGPPTVICVGIDEEDLPEDFCCDKCSH